MTPYGNKFLIPTMIMTRDALRVLGTAYRVTPELPKVEREDGLEQGLVFVGLVGMIDPPRPEVPPALETGRHAGIRTVMITGDYPNTARAIAEFIGLMTPRTPGAHRPRPE